MQIRSAAYASVVADAETTGAIAVPLRLTGITPAALTA
jgi:hypothetical protein